LNAFGDSRAAGIAALQTGENNNMKKLLLSLFAAAVLSVAPANAQSSTTLTFPGYSGYFETTNQIYCDSTGNCYYVDPFVEVLGPDDGVILLLNPYTWAIVFEYFLD
jgi:hypothetical protein